MGAGRSPNGEGVMHAKRMQYTPGVANLQVRNMPAELHDELRRRAKARGISLRDLVLEMLTHSCSTPDLDSWLARLRTHEPVDLGVSAAELIRAEREERDEVWDATLGRDRRRGRRRTPPA